MPSSPESNTHDTDWPARRDAYITRIEILVEALAEEIRGVREEVNGMKSDMSIFPPNWNGRIRWSINLMTIILVLMWISILALIFVRT